MRIVKGALYREGASGRIISGSSRGRNKDISHCTSRSEKRDFSRLWKTLDWRLAMSLLYNHLHDFKSVTL